MSSCQKIKIVNNFKISMYIAFACFLREGGFLLRIIDLKINSATVTILKLRSIFVAFWWVMKSNRFPYTNKNKDYILSKPSLWNNTLMNLEYEWSATYRSMAESKTAAFLRSSSAVWTTRQECWCIWKLSSLKLAHSIYTNIIFPM